MQVAVHTLPQRYERQAWEAWREMLWQGDAVAVTCGSLGWGILGDEPMIEANRTVAAFEYT